jgi:hypothetical protein
MLPPNVKKGTKVRFHGFGGFPKERLFALEHLERNRLYTVEAMKPNANATGSLVYLYEKMGYGFNSVLFEIVE